MIFSFFVFEDLEEQENNGYRFGGAAMDVIVRPEELWICDFEREGSAGEHIPDRGRIERHIVAMDFCEGAMTGYDLLDGEVAGTTDITPAAFQKAGISGKELSQFVIN